MTHSTFTGRGAGVELWYSQRGGATTTALALRKHWLQDEFNGGGVRLLSLAEAASRDIRLSHYHHGHSGLLREGSNVPANQAARTPEIHLKHSIHSPQADKGRAVGDPI